MNMFQYLCNKFNNWAIESDRNLRIAICLMWAAFGVFVVSVIILEAWFLFYIFKGTIFYSNMMVK